MNRINLLLIYRTKIIYI